MLFETSQHKQCSEARENYSVWLEESELVMRLPEMGGEKTLVYIYIYPAVDTRGKYSKTSFPYTLAHCCTGICSREPNREEVEWLDKWE